MTQAKLYGSGGAYALRQVESAGLALAADIAGNRRLVAGRVLLKADNSPAYLCALLALMHLGASVVLVDHRETAAATAEISRRCRAELVVTDREDVPGMPVVRMAGLLDGGQDVRLRPRLGAWLKRPDALVMCSSGSSGVPKLVAKSGQAMLRNLRRTIDVLRYGPSDTLLPLLPFSHQYGLSLLLAAWLAEASLVVAPYSRLDHALAMAGAAGATVVDAVPATYRSLLNIARRQPGVLGVLKGMRLHCTGGAPLGDGTAREFQELVGAPLLDGYGSTELGNVSFATPESPVACGPVLRGISVRVVDEHGRPCPSGRIGTVHVRTRDLFTGYLTGDGSLEPAPPTWYDTHDHGLIDDDGNLVVAGRAQAVDRAGHTLYPAAIARRASACGGGVLVVPVPDERLGHRLVFFVEDAEQRAPAFWRARLDAVLSAAERPNRVVVMERLPLTNNGKPDLVRLQRLAAGARSAARSVA